MSDVIENTFSSLSRLLNENLISSISGAPQGNVKVHGASKGFENFIRAVCSARDKHVIWKSASFLLSPDGFCTNAFYLYVCVC